jgi:hypothetical protein
MGSGTHGIGPLAGETPRPHVPPVESKVRWLDPVKKGEVEGRVLAPGFVVPTTTTERQAQALKARFATTRLVAGSVVVLSLLVGTAENEKIGGLAPDLAALPFSKPGSTTTDSSLLDVIASTQLARGPPRDDRGDRTLLAFFHTEGTDVVVRGARDEILMRESAERVTAALQLIAGTVLLVGCQGPQAGAGQGFLERVPFGLAHTILATAVRD